MCLNPFDDYNAEIQSQREIWKKKDVLRLIYRDWYLEIIDRMKNPDQGINVELGCGCGNFKEFFPNVISTDIFPNPWVDVVTSGVYLPFSPRSVDNLILIDVLHHIQHPVAFLSQAEAILKPGGRIILVEPFISWASYFIYRFLHHELDLHQEVFKDTGQADLATVDDFANAALPTILFERQWAYFNQRFPRLYLVEKRFFSFWAYPLSGGFNYKSLIGRRSYLWLSRLERTLEKPLGRYLALRIFVVLEKH